MSRTTSRREAHVQQDRPAATTPVAHAPGSPPHAPGSPGGAGGAPEPPVPERLSRKWQIVAFLWGSTFFFLWMFELLTALFRAMRGSGS